jgi:hypothetical protein
MEIFSPNGIHNVFVKLNPKTGLCETLVVDPRTDTVFDQDLSVQDYNLVVDLLKKEDHRYMINILNSRFVKKAA